MTIDLNVFCFVFFVSIFCIFYMVISVKVLPEKEFLLNINWRDQLSLAELEDQSADYWAYVLNESKNQQQQRFCFQKVHEAIKAADAMKKHSELEKQCVSKNDANLKLPNNVINMFS